MVICHTGIIASIFCSSLTNHVGKLKFDLPTWKIMIPSEAAQRVFICFSHAWIPCGVSAKIFKNNCRQNVIF